MKLVVRVINWSIYCHKAVMNVPCKFHGLFKNPYLLVFLFGIVFAGFKGNQTYKDDFMDISINGAGVIPLTANKEVPTSTSIDPQLVDLSNHDVLKDRIASAEDRENKRIADAQKAAESWHEQQASPQHTVIEKNGQVIGSFGENGFKFFASNGDGVRNSDDSINVEATLEALKEKYGASLEIKQYELGEGPTWAEIYEKTYGFKATPPKLDLNLIA
ncbi:hypothetical protein C2869_05410 [Saccharobesus litoralis]|uniref:Uncharacterized protein n=2 Tax=Saccharobesus litoralis TaxID=2172099 RepID=A0A2S0VNY1_9ALTE|nr:hypothetical protein C2869_05410 [Saccharobesus litoralis]